MEIHIWGHFLGEQQAKGSHELERMLRPHRVQLHPSNRPRLRVKVKSGSDSTHTNAMAVGLVANAFAACLPRIPYEVHAVQTAAELVET